jgi:hypothetical protein
LVGCASFGAPPLLKVDQFLSDFSVLHERSNSSKSHEPKEAEKEDPLPSKGGRG